MGRKKGQGQAVRNPYCCTMCGSELPKDSSDWGLSWSGDSGVCAPCLTDIRTRFPRKRKASHDPLRTTEND